MHSWRRVAFFVGVFLALRAVPAEAGAVGLVDCEAQENGQIALASFRVLTGENQIAKGVCGRPAEVASGSYEIRITLDGAADSPNHAQRIEVKSGAKVHVPAKFETGEIVVEITRDGRRSIGVVRLTQGSKTLATLSAGVPHRVSTGTYGVEIEAKGETRALDAVTISRGELRAIRADLTATPR